MRRGGLRLSTATRLFITGWVVYSLHFATDIVREHYPAFSLAERGTLAVDPYLGLHPDLFEIAGRGAFINNNPGASLIAAVPYAVTRPLVDRVVSEALRARVNAEPPSFDDPRPNRRRFFELSWSRGLDVRFGLAAGIIQALGTAPIAAAMLVVMHAVLRRLSFSPRAAIWLTLTYAFATPLFFRSAFLNHNLLVAHATLCSFALLWRGDTVAVRAGPLVLAGFSLGAAIAFDYAGVIPAGVVGLYASHRLIATAPRSVALRGVGLLAAGAALPVACLLTYQWWAFGNPWFPAQHYMPATQYSGHGWNGFDWPAPDLLLQNLFDPRFGLFAFGPLLLLACAHPWLSRSGEAHVQRPERVLAWSLFVGLLLFTSANQYARLQWNTGFRMLAPVVPLLFLLCADVLHRLPRNAAIAIGVAGVLQGWALAMVRADPFASASLVLTEGPRLPWVTSLWRAGEAYLPVAGSPSLLSVPFFGLGGALLAWVWTRPEPSPVSPESSRPDLLPPSPITPSDRARKT